MLSATCASTVCLSRSRFTGNERDTESGNDYFGARYYASAMGRFMSPDWSAKAEPVPYSKLDDPQTLNLYSYVGNNPLVRTDQDGHCFWDLCIVEITVADIVIGALITGGIALGVEKTIYESRQAAPGSRPGQDFTRAGKNTIDQTNAAQNGGDNKCVGCKKKVRKVSSKKGEPTPDDQLQRHHIDPKENGGSGTPENGEIRCPPCHQDVHNPSPVPDPTPAPEPAPAPQPEPQPAPQPQPQPEPPKPQQ
jgi:RHS repeat-associated protein